MERGYIKLWRKSIDSAVFQNPDLWKLFCLCIMKANHGKAFVFIDGVTNPIEIHPGQFVTGRFSLHKDFYPKKSKNNKSALTLWRWMKSLENMQILNIKTNNKYSIITVDKWHLYQSDMNTQMNNKRTTDEQQMNTNKNNKKEKNDLYNDQANAVLDYLNKKTNRSYRNTNGSLKHIYGRLGDGYTKEDCIRVIDIKMADQYFIDNPKYLNPETLFRPTNFEKYINEPLPKKEIHI